MGTVGYMSPEQALGKALDFRSDQFSFGSILYEMATGKRAFARGNTPETLTAILREEPEPIGNIAPVTPAPLRWVIERCLAKQPDERYASTRDLARDLATLKDRLSETSGAAAAATARLRPGAPIWMRVALAALAALAGILLLSRARKPPPVAGPTRFLVDTSSSASFFSRAPVTGLAVSPDGRRIAFVAGSASRFRLWVRSLEEVEPRALPGTEWAASPFWSPDGRQVAFFAGGKLQRIAVAGGPPQVICEAPFGASGTWSPEDVILIGGGWSGANGEILRVSAEGGSPVALTKAPEKHRYLWPDFLPDGRRFLFLDQSPEGEKNTVCIGSLDSREIHPLFEADSRVEYAPPGYLLFVRDAALLARPVDPKSLAFTGEAIPVAPALVYFRRTGSGAFSASAGSSVLAYQPRPFDSRLVWLDREGRSLGSVGRARDLPSAAASLARRPPGGRVGEGTENGNPRRLDLRRRERAADANARGDRGRISARLVPGRYAPRLCLGARGPSGHLRPRPRERTRRSGALAACYTGSPLAWSPDGTRIVYGDYSPSRRPPFRVGVLLLGAKAKPEPPTSGPPYSEYDARYSPDGRWLALVSEESGEPEIYLVPAGGSGERRRVSSAGGDHPRWRGDGRELYYLDGGGRVIAVPRHGRGFRNRGRLAAGAVFRGGLRDRLRRHRRRATAFCFRWEPRRAPSRRSWSRSTGPPGAGSNVTSAPGQG